jgi:hypothetical protein
MPAGPASIEKGKFFGAKVHEHKIAVILVQKISDSLADFG